MKQEIKDNRNQRIGYIDEWSKGLFSVLDKNGLRKLGEMKIQTNGDIEARDNRLNLIGVYDISQDCTYDGTRRNKIGKGNLLTQLYFN